MKMTAVIPYFSHSESSHSSFTVKEEGEHLQINSTNFFSG